MRWVMKAIRPPFAAQRRISCEDRLAVGKIQRGSDFVEDENARVAGDQRPGKHDQLLHRERQFAGGPLERHRRAARAASAAAARVRR